MQLLDRLIDAECEKRKLQEILRGAAGAAHELAAEFEGVVRIQGSEAVVIAVEVNGIATEQAYPISQFVDGKVPNDGDRVLVSVRVITDTRV